MSNENNITNNLVKIETVQQPRSTSLDLQLWSHAWEEAYLSEQSKQNVDVAKEKTETEKVSLEKNNTEKNLKDNAIEVAKSDNRQLNVSTKSAVINSVDQPEKVLAVDSKNGSTRSFTNSYGLANSDLHLTTNKAKTTIQSTPSTNLPKSAKLEMLKPGFHVYVTESGEIKVWLRNQSLSANTGLALLQKMRSTFNLLGYTLTHFTLNGENIFTKSDSKPNEPTDQVDNSQPFVDKSY